MIPFEPFDQIFGGFLGKEEKLPEVSQVSSIVQLDQVHSDQIFLIRRKEDIERINGAQGDAIICVLPQIGIAVRTADCVPVLIAHDSGIIASVHAGWRGTQKGILRKTIEKIIGDFAVKVEGFQLSIGPSICVRCYEVGEEVATQFPNDPINKRSASIPGKYFLDLKRMNLQQALSLDISSHQIEIREECTFCHSSHFHSHRKRLSEGNSNSGRNYSWMVSKKEVNL